MPHVSSLPSPASCPSRSQAFVDARNAAAELPPSAATEPAQLLLPASLRSDLRSDHAGETGAVWIYRGVLAVARDAGLRAFAQRHLATEREHLRLLTWLRPWAVKLARLI